MDRLLSDAKSEPLTVSVIASVPPQFSAEPWPF
jgi:hypothetical protein